MDDAGPALIVMFLLGFLTDIVYVWGTKSIANNKALQAACGNTLLTMIGLSATWIVIDNKSVLEAVIYIIGCFLGTYITMKFGDKYTKMTSKDVADVPHSDIPYVHSHNRRVD